MCLRFSALAAALIQIDHFRRAAGRAALGASPRHAKGRHIEPTLASRSIDRDHPRNPALLAALPTTSREPNGGYLEAAPAGTIRHHRLVFALDAAGGALSFMAKAGSLAALAQLVSHVLHRIVLARDAAGGLLPRDPKGRSRETALALRVLDVHHRLILALSAASRFLAFDAERGLARPHLHLVCTRSIMDSVRHSLQHFGRTPFNP